MFLLRPNGRRAIGENMYSAAERENGFYKIKDMKPKKNAAKG